MTLTPDLWYCLHVSIIERVPVISLQIFPGNPRKGNKKLIRESLLEFGQTRPLHARRADSTVIMGNNTLECMRELEWKEADVVFHDVSLEAARRIALMDNRTADMGLYDEEALLAQLQALDGDYQGTGYSLEDENRLLDLIVGSSREEFWELEGDEPAVELDRLPDTGAGYAENPLQEAARADRQAQQVTRAVAGTRELVLVYPDSEHAEVISMLDNLREKWALRAPQVIFRLLREASRE